jgi:hypothetical protein
MVLAPFGKGGQRGFNSRVIRLHLNPPPLRGTSLVKGG